MGRVSSARIYYGPRGHFDHGGGWGYRPAISAGLAQRQPFWRAWPQGPLWQDAGSGTALSLVRSVAVRHAPASAQ